MNVTLVARNIFVIQTRCGLYLCFVFVGEPVCTIGAQEWAHGEVRYSFLSEQGVKKCVVANCSVSLGQSLHCFVYVTCTTLYADIQSSVYTWELFYSAFPIITRANSLQTDPFPDITETHVPCSGVSDNCSVPSTPYQRNLSICCKYCSGQNSPTLCVLQHLVWHDCLFAADCDFLTCPQHSNCEKGGTNSALCRCVEGYEETVSSSQLSCVGKPLH